MYLRVGRDRLSFTPSFGTFLNKVLEASILWSDGNIGGTVEAGSQVEGSDYSQPIIRNLLDLLTLLKPITVLSVDDCRYLTLVALTNIAWLRKDRRVEYSKPSQRLDAKYTSLLLPSVPRSLAASMPSKANFRKEVREAAQEAAAKVLKSDRGAEFCTPLLLSQCYGILSLIFRKKVAKEVPADTLNYRSESPRLDISLLFAILSSDCEKFWKAIRASTGDVPGSEYLHLFPNAILLANFFRQRGSLGSLKRERRVGLRAVSANLYQKLLNSLERLQYLNGSNEELTREERALKRRLRIVGMDVEQICSEAAEFRTVQILDAVRKLMNSDLIDLEGHIALRQKHRMHKYYEPGDCTFGSGTKLAASAASTVDNTVSAEDVDVVPAEDIEHSAALTTHFEKSLRTEATCGATEEAAVINEDTPSSVNRSRSIISTPLDLLFWLDLASPVDDAQLCHLVRSLVHRFGELNAFEVFETDTDRIYKQCMLSDFPRMSLANLHRSYRKNESRIQELINGLFPGSSSDKRFKSLFLNLLSIVFCNRQDKEWAELLKDPATKSFCAEITSTLWDVLKDPLAIFYFAFFGLVGQEQLVVKHYSQLTHPYFRTHIFKRSGLLPYLQLSTTSPLLRPGLRLDFAHRLIAAYPAVLEPTRPVLQAFQTFEKYGYTIEDLSDAIRSRKVQKISQRLFMEQSDQTGPMTTAAPAEPSQANCFSAKPYPPVNSLPTVPQSVSNEKPISASRYLASGFKELPSTSKQLPTWTMKLKTASPYLSSGSEEFAITGKQLSENGGDQSTSSEKVATGFKDWASIWKHSLGSGGELSSFSVHATGSENFASTWKYSPGTGEEQSSLCRYLVSGSEPLTLDDHDFQMPDDSLQCCSKPIVGDHLRRSHATAAVDSPNTAPKSLRVTQVIQAQPDICSELRGSLLRNKFTEK